MRRMEEWTDADLVRAAGRGDERAFTVLYYRHRDWVLGLAWRFCRDEEIALDVLQETFSYLLRKLPGLTLSATFKTFLYPVVKHLTRDEKLRRGRLVTGSELPEQWIWAPSETGSREELALALTALSEEQREVLLLRFVDGLSLLEIAQALEIPLGTVKSRLHLALKILREEDGAKDYFLE